MKEMSKKEVEKRLSGNVSIAERMRLFNLLLKLNKNE